jgi:glycosyltransferase involved in cell wall biosynthesis
VAVIGSVCHQLDFDDAYVTRFPRVDSIAAYYAAAKVCIVPIFEGTGLSIKTLEGLAMGRAMVVTPVGARGLDDGANAYVKVDMKASPRQTAEAILDLLTNPLRRKRLELAAAAYILRCFGREAYFGGMDRALRSAGLDPLAGVPRLGQGGPPGARAAPADAYYRQTFSRAG